MLHTIQEAMALTGKSRRTIYNHCDAGRVSYTVGPDGRRYFETAELERAYGLLPQVAHTDAQQIAQVGTPYPDDLREVIEAAVAAAVAPLVERIDALQELLRRIEYKPEPVVAVQVKSTPADAPAPAGERQQVKSFADLLAGLD